MYQSREEKKQQISLAQNKSLPKKCIIQWFRLYNAPNLRDKMLDYRVIILALDVKIKCKNMRHNMAEEETFVQLNSNSTKAERVKKQHHTNKKVQKPNRIGFVARMAGYMAKA